MSVLVLGGEGMLGHKVFQTLSATLPDVSCTLLGRKAEEAYRRIDLFQTPRVLDSIDITDFARLADLLEEMRPQTVVNCIGIVKQRAEANEAIPSIEINSLLPHRLVETCRPWAGRVIHFSTDCVFSGRRGGYTEEDVADAEDLYGRTKFLGETAADNAVTLRTSIIGRELFHFRSLLEWFLSQNHRTVKGFRGAIYSGVTTNHMADLVAQLITHHPGLSGLYHVVAEPISKYDLLCLVREAYDLDVEIVPDDEFQCDRSMKGDKLRNAIGYVAPPWPELVRQLAEDPTPYGDWRAER